MLSWPLAIRVSFPTFVMFETAKWSTINTRVRAIVVCGCLTYVDADLAAPVMCIYKLGRGPVSIETEDIFL